MRKIVAMAFVLVVGAAVVLWYGNTLNSWVVGGLIGGFGALLLSIPISLVLFSYFSQHYAERQPEEALEHQEISLAQRSSYAIVQDQSMYEGHEKYLDYQDQEFEYDEEDIYDDELVQVQRDHYGADLERQSVQRRKSESRPVKAPDSPRSSYSRYRSQALRAARAEAALQVEYQEERVFPLASTTRRLGQMQRSSKDGRLRSSRDLGQSSMDGYAQRPRRIVESLPPQDSRQPLSAPDDARPTNRFAHYRDTQTEYDVDEDDTLREEMAQYVAEPIVRHRSSRYLKHPFAGDAQ